MAPRVIFNSFFYFIVKMTLVSDIKEPHVKQHATVTLTTLHRVLLGNRAAQLIDFLIAITITDAAIM